MELRVAASQIEGACPPRQLAITQGAEKGQLATQVLERAQVLLVVERERLVTRNGDDGPRSRDRLQPVRFLADIGCRRRYFEQAVDVDALFHQLGHLVDARGELLDLVGGHKPQMPAFERERLVGGNITQNRDARVLLDRRRRVGAAAALVLFSTTPRTFAQGRNSAMPRITAASDKDAPRPFTTKTTGVSVSRATW